MSHPELISRVRGTPIKLVFCGLDFAGKTAMFQRWKTGKFEPNLQATTAFTWETVSIGEGLLRATIYDMGGQEKLRGMWEEIIAKTDAVIFVVDASDPERFPEAKKEFHDRVISRLDGRPCAICANKLDLIHQNQPNKNPMELINEVKKQVEEALAIPKSDDYHLIVITTSMVNGLGLDDITDFLMNSSEVHDA